MQESRATAAHAVPVAHGTAEQLARVHHFRGLTDTLPEAHELDPVLFFLLGRVDNPREVLEHLGDDLDTLWSLLTEDFDVDSDLDELTEGEWLVCDFPTAQQELDFRFAKTVARLADEVESAIRLARTVAVERRRAERAVA